MNDFMRHVTYDHCPLATSAPAPAAAPAAPATATKRRMFLCDVSICYLSAATAADHLYLYAL